MLSTIIPASLSGGGDTLTVEILGFKSIPNSSALNDSKGFCFAFMIFGREAYLGSFNLKSEVTIAGSFIEIVCKPPSTSLVTSAFPSEIFHSEAKVAWGYPSNAASI